MYHRFPAEHKQNFREQCEHIVRHYHPVSLAEASEQLRLGIPFPANALVVTVDDGYQDFRHHAFPTLKHYGIPATVFLATGFLDRLTWLWWDKVHSAFEQTTRKSAVIPLSSGSISCSLSTPEERKQSFLQVVEPLTRVPNQERIQLVASLSELLDVSLPAVPPSEFEALRWDQVREMSTQGIDFGAHTVTHPILSRLESAEELRWEMEHSRVRIEAELGRPATHFCYPSGRAEDLDGRVKKTAQAAGFTAAVTTEPGFCNSASDLLLLRRIGVEPFSTRPYFSQQLAGFRVPQ